MAAYLPLAQIQKIYDQMIRSDAKLWWVMENDNKTVIAENESNSGTIQDCFNELAEVLNSLTGDYVIVTVRNKLPNKDADGNFVRGAGIKGVAKYDYRVKVTPDPMQTQRPGMGAGMYGMGMGGDQTLILGLYDKISGLEARNIETAKNAEIEALKRELKENKAGDYTSQLIEALAKEAVGMLASKNGFPPLSNTPVNGNTAKPDESRKPMTEDEKKKAAEDLSANMKEVTNVMGADFYELMAALAKNAKGRPEVFKTYAAQIIKSAQ